MAGSVCSSFTRRMAAVSRRSTCLQRPVLRSGARRSFWAAAAADATLVERIKSEVQANTVTVYSKTYCPYCSRVKQLFTDLAVPHTVYELDNLGEGDALQSSLASITGRRTVPQVFVGGDFVGGCDDTLAEHSAGNLTKRLQAAGVSGKF